MTVIENLMAGGPIYGLTKSETATRAADLLGLFDLIQGRHTVACHCSFGMRKKTALAMALLHKPKVLLLDEPFDGIDPASSAVIQMLLSQLSRDGTTILLTSHILSVVKKIDNHSKKLCAEKLLFEPKSILRSFPDILYSLAADDTYR